MAQCFVSGVGRERRDLILGSVGRFDVNLASDFTGFQMRKAVVEIPSNNVIRAFGSFKVSARGP